MARQTIPLYKVHMPEEVSQAVTDVLFSGQIAHGPNVARMETMLQEYVGNPYITTTGDISSSIDFCLYLAGVRPDDEVISSPMACLATNTPIKNVFARVKWCDVDPLTGNISPEDIQQQITSRTRAILVYHWAGNPVDIDAINAIARRYDIRVVEDAGEAMGATYHGKMIGNTGTDYTVFSFHAIRHITSGDGAAVAFNRQEEFERGRWLKRYGIHLPSFRDELGEINPASDVLEAGYNSYMNHICATIGVTQMPYLADIVSRHQANGLYYDEALKDLSGITLLRREEGVKSAYWVYTLLAERRDDLMKSLRAKGVFASKVHLRNDIYSCFEPANRPLPGVEYFDQHYLSIPSGWWVTEEDREYIVSCIKAGW